MKLTKQKKVERPTGKLITLDFSRGEFVCPKCGFEMMDKMVLGIHVEKCPACEGIFLDKGEAELLVRRALAIWQYEVE